MRFFFYGLALLCRGEFFALPDLFAVIGSAKSAGMVRKHGLFALGAKKKVLLF